MGGAKTNRLESLQDSIDASHPISWKEFKIGELFEISTPKKKFNAVDLEFNGIYPYVARGDKNNGIRGYINENIKFLNPANTISFGQDTATMFYQKDAYFTGDKIKIFTFKFPNFNALIANFLIARMKKAFSAFSWGSSSFEVSVLKDTKITLPVCENGEINFAFMESFIKATQKQVIKSVVLYSESKLKAYKKVIASA